MFCLRPVSETSAAQARASSVLPDPGGPAWAITCPNRLESAIQVGNVSAIPISAKKEVRNVSEHKRVQRDTTSTNHPSIDFDKKNQKCWRHVLVVTQYGPFQ